MNYIYLDNATITKVHKEVIEKMMTIFENKYALATSQFSHTMGLESKEAYEEARNIIAHSIGAESENIIFTSGSTETNNLAIKGYARANKRGNHLITTSVSDRSVLNSMETLKKEGFDITVLSVDSYGRINLEELEKNINKNTILISFELANHEVGTIENYRSIVNIAKKHNIAVHMDASYGYLEIPINVNELYVDLITLTAHRIHGPSGVGALYIKKGAKVKKLMDGGFNEMNFRAGNESIPLSVGFGKSVELFDREIDVLYTAKLKKLLISKLNDKIKHISINGDPDNSLSNLLNVTFHRVEGESVALHFDMEGIEVITGSACFSKSLEPSYILMALYNDHERAHGSITFSFSRYNTENEILKTANVAKRIVDKLIKFSPLKEE